MPTFRCWRPGWGEDAYKAILADDAEDAAKNYAEREADGPDYPEQVCVRDTDGTIRTFNISTEIDVIFYASEAD